MKCPRCNNEVNEYFYLGSKGYYCRKCIKFKRRLIKDSLKTEDYPTINGCEDLFLNYQLSEKQKLISEECAKNIIDNDVLLHCVCGAGKTEIVLQSISETLARGKNVCYAISRRQVVLEIGERLSEIFSKARVVSVCGGYTSDLYGDIIVCTTHQLYRYEKLFDLLILDECDAFPFKGNDVLQNIAANSVKGHIIYSTATIDDYLISKIKDGLIKLELNKRYHGYDLPVPKQIMGPKIYLIFKLYKFVKNNNNPLIVFVPTKIMCKKYYNLFKIFINCEMITSATVDKEKIIQKFRDRDVDLIFATTILERGVTFSGVDVVIMNVENRIYDLSSLIQMSGRVGRKIEKPAGTVLFMQNAYSENANNCIKEIIKANA
jgi:competence protein ComFA